MIRKSKINVGSKFGMSEKCECPEIEKTLEGQI